MRAATDGTSVETVAASQDVPAAVCVDASGVYWTNGGQSGTVLTRALDGGLPVLLVAGQSPSAITTDINAVYFTNPGGGTIMKVAKP